jgi:hypothetical protein
MEDNYSCTLEFLVLVLVIAIYFYLLKFNYESFCHHLLVFSIYEDSLGL